MSFDLSGERDNELRFESDNELRDNELRFQRDNELRFVFFFPSTVQREREREIERERERERERLHDTL